MADPSPLRQEPCVTIMPLPEHQEPEPTLAEIEEQVLAEGREMKIGVYYSLEQAVVKESGRGDRLMGGRTPMPATAADSGFTACGCLWEASQWCPRHEEFFPPRFRLENSSRRRLIRNRRGAELTPNLYMKPFVSWLAARKTADRAIRSFRRTASLS